MITPFDIEKKEFSKGVRGYNIDEVNEFLDQIIVDLEKIMKENLRLKTEISALEQENAKYKGSEGEVVKVLEQAQSLMGDISASAEKRAEVLLKNAELDAELTVREARDRAERLKDENKNLEKRYVAFRDKYKKYLEDELARFNAMSDDLFPQFDDSRLEDLVNAPMGPSATQTSAAETRVAAPEEVPEVEKIDIEKTLFAGISTEEAVDERKTVVMNPADFDGQ